jgi:hypothetical protein
MPFVRMTEGVYPVARIRRTSLANQIDVLERCAAVMQWLTHCEYAEGEGRPLLSESWVLVSKAMQ